MPWLSWLSPSHQREQICICQKLLSNIFKYSRTYRTLRLLSSLQAPKGLLLFRLHRLHCISPLDTVLRHLKWFHMVRNGSKWFKMVQNFSKWFQMVQNNAIYAIWFQWIQMIQWVTSIISIAFGLSRSPAENWCSALPPPFQMHAQSWGNRAPKARLENWNPQLRGHRHLTTGPWSTIEAFPGKSRNSYHTRSGDAKWLHQNAHSKSSLCGGFSWWQCWSANALKHGPKHAQTHAKALSGMHKLNHFLPRPWIKRSALIRAGCCCWHPQPYCIKKDPMTSWVLICMEVHGVAHSKLHLWIKSYHDMY